MGAMSAFVAFMDDAFRQRLTDITPNLDVALLLLNIPFYVAVLSGFPAASGARFWGKEESFSLSQLLFYLGWAIGGVVFLVILGRTL